MHRCGLVALGLLVGAGCVQAAEPAPVEKTGIQVGEKAPQFELMDHDGKQRTLKGLLKQGPVALVFYRSASW